jgi:Tfp pilus assembly protein PilN
MKISTDPWWREERRAFERAIGLLVGAALLVFAAFFAIAWLVLA